MKTNTCKSCQACIVWAITDAGKRMPVDVNPCSDGNLALEERSGADPLAKVVTPTYEGPRYKSHFSTCPDAMRHRRAR